MLTPTLLFAFLLSFAFPEWRGRWILEPLNSYAGWLIKTFSLQDSGWLPVAFILPLLLLVNLLDEFFSGLFYMAVLTLVAWFVLDRQSLGGDSAEGSTETLFCRINEGLFCAALWFVLVHPLAAVGYRLMIWMSNNRSLSGHDDWSPTLTMIGSWMEWPATFVTAACVSLAGKTRNGFRQLMLFPILADNIEELNRMRVLRTAEAALGDDITDQLARQAAARQLVIRGFLFVLLALWMVELAL